MGLIYLYETWGWRFLRLCELIRRLPKAMCGVLHRCQTSNAACYLSLQVINQMDAFLVDLSANLNVVKHMYEDLDLDFKDKV